MSTKIKYFITAISVVLLSLLIYSCTKDNFTEPVDPFVAKRLEPNPETFILGQGNNALDLKVNHTSIIDTTGGTRIKGSIYIKNQKYGDLLLTNGDFELTNNDSGSNSTGLYFTGFHGSAILSLPQEGLLKNLTIPGLTAAPIGFKKGSEFETGSFAWPVNPDRYYFYYENLNPFPINITNSSLENIKKIALDPLDPFFFVSCDFNGTKLGDLSDVGVGISAQGLIPFTPLVEISEINIPSFEGNFYISGTIPLGEYPASFTGEAVLGFNSAGTVESDKFFDGKNANFKMGLNGQLNFDSEALDWMQIDVTLGQATIEYQMDDNGNTKLAFAGYRQDPPISVSDFIKEIVGKDWNFLDYLSPVSTKELFYGSIGTKLSDFEMGFKLKTWLNLPGGYNLDIGKADFFIDPNLMHFKGESVVAGFNRVGVSGNVQKNGHFTFKGYEKSDFSTHWHSLSLGYSMGMSVTLYYDGALTFNGKVHLSGHACITILKHDYCARFHIDASVTVSTNGHFKVCFSIGIGKLGYDVCLNYNHTSSNIKGVKYEPEMRYNEIPLSQVPVQNRFPLDKLDK